MLIEFLYQAHHQAILPTPRYISHVISVPVTVITSRRFSTRARWTQRG